jgi:hypothetical protein
MENGDLSIVFSFQGSGGSLTGRDPENRVGNQDTGSQGWPVSSGLQVTANWGNVVQEQDPLGVLPAGFFLKNVLQFYQQR